MIVILPIKKFAYRTLLNCATWTERSRPSVLPGYRSFPRTFHYPKSASWMKSCSFVVWSVCYVNPKCVALVDEKLLIGVFARLDRNQSFEIRKLDRAPTWMRNASIHPFPVPSRLLAYVYPLASFMIHL